MRILFILDTLQNLKIYKDTSISIMYSIKKFGYEIETSLSNNLFINNHIAYVYSVPIKLINKNDKHQRKFFFEGHENKKLLNKFNALIFRKNPPFDIEYFYLTYILDNIKKNGINVINNGELIRNYSEKLSIIKFRKYTPKTLISKNLYEIKSFLKYNNNIIIKKLNSMGGEGIFKIKKNDSNFNSIIEMITLKGKNSIIVQKYISNILHGDKRIIIVGNYTIPYSLSRISKPFENRNNISAGGFGIVQRLSNHEYKISEFVKSYFKKSSFLLIGLDVVGNYLIEANITSPTCFVEIKNKVGFDISFFFIKIIKKNK